jgi:hypothetical protein
MTCSKAKGMVFCFFLFYNLINIEFYIFINTPFPTPAEAGQAFPQGGRRKTFPPWGK